MTFTFPNLPGNAADQWEHAAARDISQEEGDITINNTGCSSTDALLDDDDKHFDNEADAREYIFPQLEEDHAPQTADELAWTWGGERHLNELRLDAIATPGTARSLTPPATPGTISSIKNPVPRQLNFELSPATMRQLAPPPSRNTPLDDSTLASVSKNNPSIWITANLYEFLDWQAGRRGSPSDQGKFKDNAFNFPGLLVFVVMQPKTQIIQLLHSIQVYPNSPGSDPNWRGKTIGFLGDK